VVGIPGIELVRVRKVDSLLFDHPGEIGWGGNGGFQLLNLVLQWGATRVLLVGFDCSIEKGRHFFGSHPSPLDNPRQAGVDRWRAALDSQKPLLDLMGVSVINCAPHSRLSAFPRQPLLEALADASLVSERR
jgi:hypothetical protein